MPYYDNAGMLGVHIDEWMKWPEAAVKGLKIVIVDDGTPEGLPASRVIQARMDEIERKVIKVSVYRVAPDIPWNQDGARNLGMKECRTPFALMTDMDHLLPARMAERLAYLAESGTIRDRTYLMPRQWVYETRQEIPPHPNTFLFRVSEFWEMGGYDEDFAGHYGSDGNFRKCCKGLGLQEIQTQDFGLLVYRRTDVPDASTRNYGRKESQYSVAHNPALMAKRKGPAYRAVNPIRFEWRREI
jgi:hypothetical protein